MGQIPSHIQVHDDWQVKDRRTRANSLPLVMIGVLFGCWLALMLAGHPPL
jgi:hypothetical protein